MRAIGLIMIVVGVVMMFIGGVMFVFSARIGRGKKKDHLPGEGMIGADGQADAMIASDKLFVIGLILAIIGVVLLMK
ncbi:hypothetical protein [Poriferisphaera sp. WC338]|uniref:hypothetical protein n=1 Tax=Poriferisphaera sp. WC338 TaxID=3425129 RepID=UPI003D8131EF